jgi:hypothetical protein
MEAFSSNSDSKKLKGVENSTLTQSKLCMGGLRLCPLLDGKARCSGRGYQQLFRILSSFYLLTRPVMPRGAAPVAVPDDRLLKPNVQHQKGSIRGI